MNNSLAGKLADKKAAVEKNEWYIYLREDLEKQLKTIQESLGTARTAEFAAMKFEQGRIDALGWTLRRPEKLMNELIKEK